MKKFKRLGTLFLCATLILSLAACGKSGSETTSGSEPPNSTASSASDDTYDEHLTLSWLQAGIKSGADYSADDWGRFWLDKFNVDFDIIAVTMDPSDWDERLRIWINSGDMPDVANAQFEFGELENYANQEPFTVCPMTGKSGGLMLLRRRKTSLLPLWPRNNSAVLTFCIARFSL